jgi:hypothetical protein
MLSTSNSLAHLAVLKLHFRFSFEDACKLYVGVGKDGRQLRVLDKAGYYSAKGTR